MGDGERLVTFGAWHWSLIVVFLFASVDMRSPCHFICVASESIWDCKYACMLKFVPVSLAACRSFP